jgi:hypothetical protein
MKNAHLRRYPHSSSLRRTSVYASLLEISDALHLDVFDQPAKQVFFSKLLRQTCRIDRYDLLPVKAPLPPFGKGGLRGFFMVTLWRRLLQVSTSITASNCLCISKTFVFKYFFWRIGLVSPQER